MEVKLLSICIYYFYKNCNNKIILHIIFTTKLSILCLLLFIFLYYFTFICLFIYFFFKCIFSNKIRGKSFEFEI